MKKLLSICFLSVASLSSQAQTYVPFPTTHALWTERHALSETMVDYRCYGLKDKDTIISGVTYHQLFLSADSVLEDSEFCGGLREDAKRIYYYDAAAAAEKLLYDFSVKVGDTVLPASTGVKAIVASFDSISIAGTYRRSIHFKALDGTDWKAGNWIEGIGNSAFGGLLGSLMMVPTCDCGSKLICAKDGEAYIYHNAAMAGMACFGSALAIDETLSLKQSPVSFNPNPVQDISLLHNTAGFSRICIINLTGQVYYNADLQPQQTLVLHKADFPTGIYFYHLEGGNTLPYTGKLIIE